MNADTSACSDEEAWDTLVSMLHSTRERWQAILKSIKRDFDDEDIRSFEDNLQPVIDTLLWLIPVAEAMCARQELRVFCPVVDHYSEISLLWQDWHVGVSAKANNLYSVSYFDCRKYGIPESTHLGEGNAEQTTECVAAFLRSSMTQRAETE